jgi:hypothetical protein
MARWSRNNREYMQEGMWSIWTKAFSFGESSTVIAWSRSYSRIWRRFAYNHFQAPDHWGWEIKYRRGGYTYLMKKPLPPKRFKKLLLDRPHAEHFIYIDSCQMCNAPDSRDATM